MAIARLGGSDTPLEAYCWGANDSRPDGTGTTTICPMPSLRFEDDGSLSAHVPDHIIFKDAKGLRPVCPFFELWGEWLEAGEVRQGPLTARQVDAADIEWTVEVANLKPFNMTGDPATRIQARTALRGDDHSSKMLDGVTPPGPGEAILPADRKIELGSVRAARPGLELPEYRLRFVPAKGLFYGPADLLERWQVSMPAEQLILNPRSTWMRWRPSNKNVRSCPSGQYAHDEQSVSYGLVDDTCDGIITCRIVSDETLVARARIVVGPPDYAPDCRPLVSIADGLKDREERDDILVPNYSRQTALLTAEAVDLFERVLETVRHMNIDVIVDRFLRSDPDVAEFYGQDYDADECFRLAEPSPGDPLPLTMHGRRQHRRLATPEFLLAYVLRNPDFVDRVVRDPATRRRVMTREMPAAMRGSDGAPLHLTRRQIGMLRLFAEAVVAHDGALDG